MKIFPDSYCAFENKKKYKAIYFDSETFVFYRGFVWATTSSLRLCKRMLKWVSLEKWQEVCLERYLARCLEWCRIECQGDFLKRYIQHHWLGINETSEGASGEINICGCIKSYLDCCVWKVVLDTQKKYSFHSKFKKNAQIHITLHLIRVNP